MLLGIDLGTTNIKAVICSRDGSVRSVFREAISYDTSSDGRCVLPADRFRGALARCVRGVCAASSVGASQIDGIGYASQANTFLLLDGDGDALTPIVSWQDRHVSAPAPSIERFFERDDFLATTGLGIWSSGLTVVKVAELRTLPLWSSVRSVLSISDYLVYLLTGEPAADESTASMLGIFDVTRRRWWDEAIEAVGIDPGLLPRTYPPGAAMGTVSSEAASVFGLATGTPVFAGGLDHYIAAVGSGAETLADACESTGTVLACIVTGSGIAPKQGGCFGPAIDGEYLLTFDNAGGAVLERYRANASPGRSFAELDRLAARVSPGAEGTIAHLEDSGNFTFAGPAPDGDGAVDEESRIGREVRAILEATALRLRRLLLRAASKLPDRVVSTGGGARSSIWTQIKSSMTGSRFYTIDAEEPAAYGGAFLAARGTGIVAKDATGVPASWISVRETVEPDREAQEFYSRWIEKGDGRCR